MNCLLVPTLALDLSLLDRLAKSIDYPIEYKVVINNGRSEWIEEWEEKNEDWIVHHCYPQNLGVAASWNTAPLGFLSDAWLIVNDDQELQPGCLEKICKSMDAHPEAHIHYVNEYQAYDIFGWTRKAVYDFGLFDTNFYPAYFKDWEMRLRFKLGGAIINVMDGITVKHGKPRPAGARYMDMLAKFKPLNEAYFIKKWGKISDTESEYKTPYNNPDLAVKDIIFDTERMKKMIGIWNEFMQEPALYD